MNKSALYKRYLLFSIACMMFSSAPAMSLSSDYSIKAAEALATVDKTSAFSCVPDFLDGLHFTNKELCKLLKNTDRVIFTFDDGPSPKSTPLVLKALKKHNIKVVFFVLGCQAEKYPELVKQIYDEGHIVGNHSYSHNRLSKLTEDKVREEIRKTNKIIESIIGETPVLMRPPYGDGANNKKLQKIAREQGVQFFLWTIDTLDWKSRNASKIISSAEKQLGIDDNSKKKKGGVVLMHDIYTTTADSLDTLISDMEKQKYCFIVPDELNKVNEEIKITREIKHKSYDPKLSGNNMLVALMQPANETIRQVDLIRAYKQGNLMLYMALHKRNL